MTSTRRKSWIIRDAIRNLLLVATVVVMPWSNSADAAVFVSVTKVKDPAGGSPFDAPDAALPAPWVSYRLSMHSDAIDMLQIYQVRISGPLHQRWIDTNSDSIFEPTASGTEQSSGDSHLLVPPGALFGSGPTETNPGTGSPLASSGTALYGIGDSLYGAWANPFVGATDLAYIVIPSGMERSLSINVQSVSPVDAFYTFTIKDFFPPVPEPASVVLAAAALAVFCVSGRSRRKCSPRSR